jgi:hypothetical protein
VGASLTSISVHRSFLWLRRLARADGALLISARLVSLRPCSIHGALRPDAGIAQAARAPTAENQHDQ